MPKNLHYLSFDLLKMPYFFNRGSTIRSLHISIKEHLNTRASSFHKHLIKCKINDNNFSVKIEVLVRKVGNFRIKEALLIAK